MIAPAVILRLARAQLAPVRALPPLPEPPLPEPPPPGLPRALPGLLRAQPGRPPLELAPQVPLLLARARLRLPWALDQPALAPLSLVR
jgi:hypothetical protein